MSRRKPLTAGDIVSFLEEMPVEYARLVSDIIRARVLKRTAQRDQEFAAKPQTGAKQPPKPPKSLPPQPPKPPKPPVGPTPKASEPEPATV